MKLDPSVSIIINNYNYAAYLADAIESALNQSHPAVEVIVVDDGSTDNSRDVIESYGEQVLPIFKCNEGQASALNAGFVQSEGEIVIFLDADDRLFADVSQRVVEAFQAQPDVAKVMYRMEVIDAAGKPTGQTKPYPHLPLRSGDLRRHELTFPFDMTWMATSGNAFAASVLRRILPIPVEDFPILADSYLAHLAPLFGRVVFLSDIGASYRVHGANHHEQSDWAIDLCFIRKNLIYGQKTCAYIKQTADQLQLEQRPARASDLYSVSLLSKRLTSLKLDPAGHPFTGDTSWQLYRAGVAAAWRRFDVSRWMKSLYTLWFTAMLVAPKPLARWLAVYFSAPEKRHPLNGLLGRFHHTYGPRRRNSQKVTTL